MPGESLLRVANVTDDTGIEAVRDALDELGVDYEFERSEPEDSYPRTVYFSIPELYAAEVERAVADLVGEPGLDAEVV